MAPKNRILVAEDDQGVRDAIERALTIEGYDVLIAEDGARALEIGGDHSPDLYLLDVMMPYVDGLSVCRTLRQRGDNTPILVLTARHEISDRVAGLDAGADDYLTKPFALDELLARIRALLRRGTIDVTDGVLEVAGVRLDQRARRVERDGIRVELTKTEFDLLELLMHNAGIVLTRDSIYDLIWGYNFETNSKSLDVYIGYLRRKINLDGLQDLIHTVRGVGYCFREA
ncbi:MAG: DNA-binding response regulator [Acidimicrobiaceae bacterium]|nr:DNA-binding response regulator [Acidimicrobiaceae bacterium]|tara:strand:- start:1848 stop:2534 length:687 start_codon:yes stop_codon:yes gene_type:complete